MVVLLPRYAASQTEMFLSPPVSRPVQVPLGLPARLLSQKNTSGALHHP